MWSAIILAGGSGSRMGADCNKVLLSLDGQSVISRSVHAFAAIVEQLIVVFRPEDETAIRTALVQDGLDVAAIRFVPGGSDRQASVWNGLHALPAECDHVLIHDGARCLVDADTIRRVMDGTDKCGACIPAVPVTDTIKMVDTQDCVLQTMDRSCLRAVQTPQGFRVSLLLAAHEAAQQAGYRGTDDASLLEQLHLPVQTVPGNRRNLKLTTPEDMLMATSMLHDDFPMLRIGHGFDVHRLTEGRALVLCGVTVPHTLGLLGHSDADVALHALMDAMLGALALGDIGQHFPDTDPRYKGISSMALLQCVVTLLQSHGARVTNADITISAQKPKLAPHIPAMRQNVADALALPLDRVSVKATTTEHLGFEGREEGISATAVCMVSQR